jgi:hypothetical protein
MVPQFKKVIDGAVVDLLRYGIPRWILNLESQIYSSDELCCN